MRFRWTSYYQASIQSFVAYRVGWKDHNQSLPLIDCWPVRKDPDKRNGQPLDLLQGIYTGKHLSQLTSCGRKWTPSSSTGQPHIRGWLRWSRWGPMIMTRTDDHDEDRWSRWGPMITMRTNDHDEDRWSWQGPMITMRTDDHDEDRWSWQGPMIMTRTWSSPDHDEGSPTLSNARRDLKRDELANVPVPLVDAAPEKK